MDKDKEFQGVGPRTERARFPLDFKLDFGTINNFWEDDLSVLSGE